MKNGLEIQTITESMWQRQNTKSKDWHIIAKYSIIIGTVCWPISLIFGIKMLGFLAALLYILNMIAVFRRDLFEKQEKEIIRRLKGYQ